MLADRFQTLTFSKTKYAACQLADDADEIFDPRITRIIQHPLADKGQALTRGTPENHNPPFDLPMRRRFRGSNPPEMS